MEAQTEIQSYLEQGRVALAQGKAREAAIAYAHGAQLEPANPAVHLGLAEANLALANFGVVQMACRKVFELQSQQSLDTKIAQALLDLLDRHYEQALQNVDAVVSEDPSIAYVHALRAYLLRANGQDYDANLARARATRLSYGGRFEGCFPALEPKPITGYAGTQSASATPLEQPETQRPTQHAQQATQAEREPIPAWSRPNSMQRSLIRTRFALSQRPGIVTTIIVGILVVCFLLGLLNNSIFDAFAQYPAAILSGEIWRVVTGMFFYPPQTNAIFGIAISILSLFFVGRSVEMLYGPVRYIVVYLLSGIASCVLAILLGTFSGPSGPLLGIFGAIGVFLIVNRRALGPFGGNAIAQWGFWLLLNLAFSYSAGPAFIQMQLGSIVLGMIIAFLLMPRGGRPTLL